VGYLSVQALGVLHLTVDISEHAAAPVATLFGFSLLEALGLISSGRAFCRRRKGKGTANNTPCTVCRILLLNDDAVE
jgi:hypothetical protein